MKILTEPNERSFAINKKNKTDPNAEYRLSGYAVPFAENGVYLMKNTLTGENAQLTAEEYEAAMCLKNESAGHGYIEKNSLTELVKRRYIVETDYDEAGQYMTTVKLIKMMQPEKPGLATYTILPTTGCNARCTYCYEEGYAVKTMTRETVDRLIDFICETRQEDTITLSWFGGEPLVCAETISYVCKELEKRGVPFKSKMITNASLMTKELAHEAKEVWKLKRVQVSLDGDKRDYTERKRYVDPVKYNYETVMRAIHFLSEEGIQVQLRANFDRDNIERLHPFFDEIKLRFEHCENVSLYPVDLYQERSKPYYIELQKQLIELKNYVKDIGLYPRSKDDDTTKIRVNNCMADDLNKSIVIDPEGKFYNCEHMPPNNTWGNIFDGVTDQKRFDELNALSEPAEKCVKCPFLPECTSFYGRHCPTRGKYCYELMCLKTEYELRKLAEKIKSEN